MISIFKAIDDDLVIAYRCDEYEIIIPPQVQLRGFPRQYTQGGSDER